MVATTETEPSAEEAFRRTLVLITMAGTTMLYSLTLTIVNITLPQLQGALSASQEQISWVITLNVVATAVATPLTGSIVALFGRRRVLITSVVGFTLATLACGLATSLESLIFFRIVQGAIGAPLVPLSQSTILQTYPREMHAKVNGYYGMSVVIGPALAPTFGGYLAQEYNWRWVFFLLIPLGIAALIGNLRYISDGGKEPGSRFDYLGFTLFSCTIVALQLVLDRGEREDWFDSIYIVSLTSFMAIAFYMFVTNTFFARQPFINPRLFLNRNYVIGLMLVFIYGSLNFTPLVLLPPLLQNLRGYPDMLIGLVLAMRGFGMILGFLVAGRMGGLDPRVGLVVGIVGVGMSGWLMSLHDLNATLFDVSWPSVLQGFGCGLMWVPLSVVTFSSMPAALMPSASALFHLLRNMGTSIFVAITIFLLLRTSKVRYSELAESVSHFDERLRYPNVVGQGGAEWLGNLGRLASEVGRQALMVGYDNSFYFYALVCFSAVPLLAFVTVKK